MRYWLESTGSSDSDDSNVFSNTAENNKQPEVSELYLHRHHATVHFCVNIHPELTPDTFTLLAMEPDNEVMNAYTVIFDQLTHLGPGDSALTRNVAERLRPELSQESRIADFGCGTGASTLMLAQCLPESHLLAVDAHAPFIEQLETAASDQGLGDRISAVTGDMSDPPPLDGVTGEFDLIWSESAIYSIGRSNAFAQWLPLLKPGGWLVFSDIIWQSEPASRSDKATQFWNREYPDITTAADVVNELAAAGFKPLEPVFAERSAWSNYYEPLRDRLRQLKKQGKLTPALNTVITGFEQEIDIYETAGNDVALAFFFSHSEIPFLDDR